MAEKTLAKPRAGKPAEAPKAVKVENRAAAPAIAAEKPVEPAKKPAAAKSAAPPAVPTFEQIAKRAYEIYAARGMAPGRDAEDWAQAERELIAEGHKNN